MARRSTKSEGQREEDFRLGENFVGVNTSARLS